MSDGSNTKQHILLLFDRPREPIFVTKGDDQIFKVPNEYLTDRYKSIGFDLSNRFSESAKEEINVNLISIPDLTEIKELGRQVNFSLFIPKHRKLAAQLIDIFLGVRNIDDLLSVAVSARDHVNPYLYNYALSVALLHRPDTHNIDLPSFIHSFPDKYVDGQVFNRAREEAAIVPESMRIPIEIPRDFTASNLEVEHRIAYFREDLGINLHHWHWHLVYPIEAERSIVAKDRRGELFYFMHQQIMARYNTERLCNKLSRVSRFDNLREPIAEAYFPKLDSLVAGRSWPARVENQKLRDLNREADQIKLDLEDMERWRDRIFGAIHRGFVVNESGENIQLTENEGIDILGNILESCILSPNRTFYGDFHNMGHTIISYVHDPDHRHLESFGVMGDSATAMRDPIFYRWHAYIDDIFQEFKSTLPRYSIAQLSYKGVTINKVELKSEASCEANVINTFWQQSDVDLSRGMDFQPRGAILVRFTHLQHTAFNYIITVNNEGEKRMGTCRIFLAPKHDEKNTTWLFADQRHMFIEMDKFTVTLRKGQNTITRQSIESSVTIPFERTFRDLATNRPEGGQALEQFNFCGCGWPQHMLAPKGNGEGFPCDLFVMISNYQDDKINQSTDNICEDASSYCGIKDRLYPDRRSMGYPFDREPRDNVQTLQQFLTPNMRTQDVSIHFTDRIVKPRSSNRRNDDDNRLGG